MTIAGSIYNTGSLLVSVLLGPAFLFSKRGRSRLLERYGKWKVPAGTYAWFHGASMGEVRGLLPLMKRLKKNLPAHRILLTATSVTGLEAGSDIADAVALLPFDSRLWIQRALSNIIVNRVIITETELWPCLVEELAERNVDITMVNARLSKYSFPRYRRYFGSLLAGMLPKITRILCSDTASAERFVELGAAASQVKVVGNTKYDSSPSVKDSEERDRLKRLFFEDDKPVFTLGSIRPGEEAVLFPPISAHLGEHRALNVVVAPRHCEKFDYFAGKLAEYGITFRRWSEKDSWNEESKKAQVVLLDGLGMLEKAYSFSDLAFIGATLVDIGGHNPLEAAAYGTPVITGPHVSNIQEIAESLQERDAIIIVSDEDRMRGVLQLLIDDPKAFEAKGSRAREVWAAHQGTVDRVFSEVFSNDL